MKLKISFLFLLFCTFALGQNRIPQNGESIIFYPLNENNNLTQDGYDCFFSFEQVTAKGFYNFKPKYHFKRNEKNMTPSFEIEKYSFLVEKQEIVFKGAKEYLLLFLTREEDGERLILRVPKFFDERSNAITQSFIKFKTYYFSSKKDFNNIVLPYINVDTLQTIKSQYENKNIIYGWRGYSKIRDDNNLWDKRLEDFKHLSTVINGDFKGFEYDKPYNGVEFFFLNLSNDLIYTQLCALVQDQNGRKIKIPVTHLVGNTELYDIRQDGVYYFLPDFFYEKEEYLQKEFKIYKCDDIVKKYTGKQIYYGLGQEYQYTHPYSKKFSAFENRILETNELYTLKKGTTYHCVRFDMLKGVDSNNRIPFAILRDSAGIEFKVPVNKVDFSNYAARVYCEKFEEYFVLSELVDSIVQKREELKRLEELAEKERILTLTKKYGKTYANFLYDQKDSVVKRFDELAKKYGKANAKLIIEGRVRLGWTKEMCRESWGSPHDINTITGSWGVHEQWVYEYSFSDSYSMYCLYFENGILTTIQD